MAPLLFGLSVSTSAAPDADPVGPALAAEELGFDFVSASDHPSGAHPTYETWTLLTWIAAATSRIAIASRVLSLPFRSPALVAKMAESLDRFAGNRLILGLGAGAADAELRAFGLPVPSARDKVDGLADALQVIRGLWQQPAFSYAGRAPGAVTCALNVEVRVGDHADASPDVLSGSPGELAGRLRELIDAGFTALNFSPAGARPAHEQVAQLAADVIPVLRGTS
jgi:alkanesulfonate monooxygenase SsuD/methylene tetrahydromethanopterin reductase-like flavin-dependent oxidoreductase (luciferase family)